MTWLGKLLGTIFGAFLLGPVGAVIGLFVGHWLDRQVNMNQTASSNNTEVQHAFFNALFGSMGRLAKIDGHVSEDEIKIARQIMQSMKLTDKQTRIAINLFREGKDPSYDADPYLQSLYKLAGRNRPLMKMFIQFQFKAAYADGPISDAEDKFIRHIADILGFNRLEFERVSVMFRAQHSFQQGQQQHSYQRQYQYQQQQYRPNNSAQELNNAFAILGIKESATKDETKRAYRKQMNQYHPDKLVAKGLPEEMMKAATEKTQAIKEAYDLIKKQRGW